MKAGRHTDQLNSASAVVALLGVIRKLLDCIDI